MKLYELIRSALLGNRSWERFSILLARVSLGTFFAISGGNKLFVASRTRQMYETLAGAGIPFPHFMTYFVSSIEFISGCLLVIGLLSSLCCAALIIQMIVAITTVQLATIRYRTRKSWSRHQHRIHSSLLDAALDSLWILQEGRVRDRKYSRRETGAELHATRTFTSYAPLRRNLR
jgi:uncharacterized membrane protein YphA (DoxX/SURF4 family)